MLTEDYKVSEKSSCHFINVLTLVINKYPRFSSINIYCLFLNIKCPAVLLMLKFFIFNCEKIRKFNILTIFNHIVQ